MIQIFKPYMGNEEIKAIRSFFKKCFIKKYKIGNERILKIKEGRRTVNGVRLNIGIRGTIR